MGAVDDKVAAAPSDSDDAVVSRNGHSQTSSQRHLSRGKEVGFSLAVHWHTLLVCMHTCLVVGLISGILPAITASKLDPVEAIRTGM